MSASETSRAAARGTVFGRFHAVVQAHPKATAFTAGAVTMSYRELWKLALAARAQISRVGRTTPGLVGILTTDRINALFAMLGVAASGHAYVLLDANDPDNRLRHIFGEAAPFTLFADLELLERAQGIARQDCAVINLDGF